MSYNLAEMKQRQFILIEVVIAFLLALSCLTPFITRSVSLYRGEMAHLEKMEKERLADWTFTEIKEMFLKNEIPWQNIPELRKKSLPILLRPTDIQIPGNQSKTVQRSFLIETKGKKTGKNEREFRNLYIHIFLDEEKYIFRLPVQKIEK